MKKKVFCLCLALILCGAFCFSVCAAGSGPVLAHRSSESAMIQIILPFVIAGVVCFVLVSQMRTAKKQTGAQEYIIEGGVHITRREDHFTHRTQTRRRVNSDRKKH